MSTLPPDAPNDGTPEGEQQPPAGGQTPPPPPGQSAPPQQPGGYQPPPPPQSGGPQQPPVGGYQQPQGGYQQPQGGHQQPQGGYQQPPQGGYPQQGGDPSSMITLNYWLSVFFTWIPALIFYFVEKDKGNQLANAFHRDNLNFSLLRTIVYVATIILGVIPYIGWIFSLLLWIASIVLFIFHIMAAAKATNLFREGRQPEFIFNIPMVK